MVKALIFQRVEGCRRRGRHPSFVCHGTLGVSGMTQSDHLTRNLGRLYGIAMTLKQWDQAKCKELSPEEADAIFFPNVGGKSKKAKLYCVGCPLEGLCLKDAIRNNSEGFFSGTTKEERDIMNKSLLVAVVDVMPPEPKPLKATQSRYLHVVKTTDPHAWLDESEPVELDLAL